MARAPLEEPDGIVLRPEVITREDESGMLEHFATLRWDPIVIRGQAARRTARHFGLGYDYESRTPRPGEPIPHWIEPVRWAAAELGGVAPAELVEVWPSATRPGRRSAGTATRRRSGSWSASRSWVGHACAFSAAGASGGASGTSSSSPDRAMSSPARRAGPGSTRSRPRRSFATRSRSAHSSERLSGPGDRSCPAASSGRRFR